MGPAASSGKADERSLPVQKPIRKSKVEMRKLRQKKEMIHVWGHLNKYKYTQSDSVNVK